MAKGSVRKKRKSGTTASTWKMRAESGEEGMRRDGKQEVKPGNLSNGTVMAYQGTEGRIKQIPVGSRKLKTVTSEHLQTFFDLLSFKGKQNAPLLACGIR